MARRRKLTEEKSGWVQPEPPEAQGKAATLTIEIRGCRVIANSETDPELLGKVCRALKSL